jgi:arginyl-tRNA synthetase
MSQLISRVEAAGGGYVNFFIDLGRFAELTMGASGGGAGYGRLDPDGERLLSSTRA